MTLAWRKATIKSSLFKVRWDAQVVDMSSLTPLEDAHGNQVSSKGWGISIRKVFVLVVAGLFLTLSCLCFWICSELLLWLLYSLFFHVALGDNASFEFLKLSRCSLISSSVQGVLPSLKVLWSIEFLISFLIACNQALGTSSSSFRRALKKCGSGRYMSTGLSLEDKVVAFDS